jgi:NAD(P)-dependent dehydrogenase (short-subunit alcohol dehydrogenase family)
MTAAFVTGASRGIGKAIALSLADGGYDVAIAARTVHPGQSHDNTLTVHKSDTRPLPGSLEETAAEIELRGRQALLVPLDLTDRKAVLAAAESVLAQWGGVDVLVHNGRYIGPGLMDLFMDTPLDAYEKFVEAHCVAPIAITRALLPAMLDRGNGCIVTITSSAGLTPPPAPAGRGGWGLAYAVGKAAGHQLVGTLHAEYGMTGLRTFNVEPGFVATERNEIVVKDFGYDVVHGAPPGVIGAVVAWLATATESKDLAGTTIDAQQFCRDMGLYPGWPT